MRLNWSRIVIIKWHYTNFLSVYFPYFSFQIDNKLSGLIKMKTLAWSRFDLWLNTKHSRQINIKEWKKKMKKNKAHKLFNNDAYKWFQGMIYSLNVLYFGSGEWYHLNENDEKKKPKLLIVVFTYVWFFMRFALHTFKK